MADKWSRILSESHIVVGLQARRKLDAIRELGSVLDNDDAIDDHKEFLAHAIRRETEASTGVGNGVAVPHVHEDSIRRQILALGISSEGIEFDSIDGQPVHIIALFASPLRHQKQHMQLLAALSRLFQQDEVRERLVAAADATEVLAILKSHSY